MNTQNDIQQITGCTADEYAEVVFNTGLNTASRITEGDEAMVSLITQTGSYWQWYKVQFINVDRIFLATAKYSTNMRARAALKQQWIDVHKEAEITSRPGSKIYSDANKILLKK
jgi:hypothetical protein